MPTIKHSDLATHDIEVSEKSVAVQCHLHLSRQIQADFTRATGLKVIEVFVE